jgi:thiol-disulfide isomerase/thioredoxin
MTIIITNVYDFDYLLNKNKYVLAFFTSKWCIQCRELKTKIRELSNKTTNKKYQHIKFAEIDVQYNNTLMLKYEIEYLPTTIIFIDGCETYRIVGESEDSIISYLDEISQC